MLERVARFGAHEPGFLQHGLEPALAEIARERLGELGLVGSHQPIERFELPLAPLERSRAPGRVRASQSLNR